MADPIANAVFGVLFDGSTEGLFVVDRRTRLITSANMRFAELLATPLDAIVGVSLDALSVEVGRELSAPGHYEDVALRRGDDYQVWVTLFVSHVELPSDVELAACTARDTTERRQLEREIVAKHSELIAAYAELERRNREIATLAWRAATGELVAGMAHHLNNPVGALASTVRRLAKIAAKIEAPEKDELVKLADRTGKVASRIETTVAAIARAASRADGEAPEELAYLQARLTDQLDEISTKESP